MHTNTSRNVPRASAIAVAVLATLASANAQLLENFENGYEIGASIIGQAGTATGWQTNSSWSQNGNSANYGFGITSTGGNEVLTIQKEVTGAQGSSSVGRMYADLGAGAYTVQFTITITDLAGFIATPDGGDYLNIFDMTGSGGDFASGGTWLIRGGNAGVPTNQSTWRFYNGNRDEGLFNQAQFVDSGISLTDDTTYTFTLNFSGSGNWTASVTDGTSTFNSDTLGFRNKSAFPSRRINFGISDGGATDQVSFDVETISVAVPEPSTTLTMLAALGAVGFVRQRKRR